MWMSHASLINGWPSLSVFADDIGVPYVTAKAMRRRSSIPSAYWLRAVEAAKARGVSNVTLEALAAYAAKDLEAAE